MSGQPLRYRPSLLEDVENLESYVENGNHPCFIGDALSNGRYIIVHKLGFGGSSTVWLARDKTTRSLVTLKIMAAFLSSRPPAEIQELAIPQYLLQRISSPDDRTKDTVQFVQDHFMENGPNGRHLCIVTPLGGPSILAVEEFLSINHNTRLRSNFTRRMAKQAAVALGRLHDTGVVHGDFTTSNILLSLKSHVGRWTNKEVYASLGPPVTEAVVSQGSDGLVNHAPREVVQAASVEGFLNHLEFSIVLSDFGQSCVEEHGLPPHLHPATVNHYVPPEMRFGDQVGFASDIWMLACAVYEIRAGHPLFDAFLRSSTVVTMEMVSALGKLPDPWWSKFESRHIWFDESGEPRPIEDQKRDGILLICERETLRQMVERIGRDEDPPVFGTSWDAFSEAREPMSSREMDLLADLLEKTLQYNPAERLTIQEVIAHPWFDLDEL